MGDSFWARAAWQLLGNVPGFAAWPLRQQEAGEGRGGVLVPPRLLPGI